MKFKLSDFVELDTNGLLVVNGNFILLDLVFGQILVA